MHNSQVLDEDVSSSPPVGRSVQPFQWSSKVVRSAVVPRSSTPLLSRLRCAAFGLVSDSTVYQAFLRVDRGDFVPPEVRPEAYYDQPLLHGKIHMSAPHIYGTGDAQPPPLKTFRQYA